MQRPPGFKSATQAENFHAAARLHRRGGPLAPVCGARTRTGAACTQLPLEGGARCLKHAGPDAARRFREGQLEGLRTGRVSPDVFARAEARRARNALLDGWKRNPSLPGATIDLAADEGRFRDAASALAVSVDGLLPAVRDWLAWRWRRTQADRRNDAAWVRAVQIDLPRRVADAEKLMVWVRLGNLDKRTKAGRALKAALRTGGPDYAAKVAADVGSVDVDTGGTAGGRPAGADMLTRLPVRAWTARPADMAGKRSLPDRVKALKPAAAKPAKMGRPRVRLLADGGAELAALAETLRTAGPAVSQMAAACASDLDRLGLARALQAVRNAPDDPTAQARWAQWVRLLA